MGQQQLLLIVLVMILVGIATIIAITTTQQASAESNIDAVRQEILQAHAQSRVFFTKPEMMGGGGSSFSAITLNDLLLAEENDNARYEIIETSADNFTLSYIPHYRDGTYTATISYDQITWNGESEE
jgi:Tfp pilus assembly protein PilE